MKFLKTLKQPFKKLDTKMSFLLICIGFVIIVWYCLKKDRESFTQNKQATTTPTTQQTNNQADEPELSEYEKCKQACPNIKINNKSIIDGNLCGAWCERYKLFDHDCYKIQDGTEAFTNKSSCQDVSYGDCLEKCLHDQLDSSICIPHCQNWRNQQENKHESCFFRPGGTTPGDCKTKCRDYYKIVNPENKNSDCLNTCENVCDSCTTAQCKWTNFQSEEEFPYQLSLFGVPGDKKVKISWEKPPYAVKKYIIMYFEEEKQHETGVKFVEKYGYQCDSGEYCSFTIGNLSNSTNYIIGVSLIFQNNNITRMSNRLVMRPEKIITQTTGNGIGEVGDDGTVQEDSATQTQTPTQILTGKLLQEQRKANSQKILTDFKKSQTEHVSDLFSYLATNPINLQFKLS